MPRVESVIVIAAPRARVLEVARDNESFPQFMADVQSLKVTDQTPDGNTIISDWVATVPKFNVPVRWTEEDVWDMDAGTCTFRQIKGDYDRFEGVWTITSEGDEQTRFASVLDYELVIPLVGPLIKNIVHKTMQVNVDSTLQAIKKRCEGGAQQPADT